MYIILSASFLKKCKDNMKSSYFAFSLEHTYLQANAAAQQ